MSYDCTHKTLVIHYSYLTKDKTTFVTAYYIKQIIKIVFKIID